MAFHSRRTLPLRAFGDLARAQHAALAAAARARDFAAAEACLAAEREAERRESVARARQARRDPSVVLPLNGARRAAQRVRSRSSKIPSKIPPNVRRDWGSGRPREFGDGKRGARWYDDTERRDGATGSVLAQQRVEAARAARGELQNTATTRVQRGGRGGRCGGSAEEKKAADRKVRLRLARLDLDCREIAARSSDEFKRGSFVLLVNGAMHKTTRQRILKQKLGGDVDVGEELHPVGWRPGYRNNINGGTRGTKIAPQKVLDETAASAAKRGAIVESNRAPVGYGGTVRLFSP
jgi:hypothetical protein